jgi:hypothetical protein
MERPSIAAARKPKNGIGSERARALAKRFTRVRQTLFDATPGRALKPKPHHCAHLSLPPQKSSANIHCAFGH